MSKTEWIWLDKDGSHFLQRCFKIWGCIPEWGEFLIQGVVERTKSLGQVASEGFNLGIVTSTF